MLHKRLVCIHDWTVIDKPDGGKSWYCKNCQTEISIRLVHLPEKPERVEEESGDCLYV